MELSSNIILLVNYSVSLLKLHILFLALLYVTWGFFKKNKAEMRPSEFLCLQYSHSDKTLLDKYHFYLTSTCNLNKILKKPISLFQFKKNYKANDYEVKEVYAFIQKGQNIDIVFVVVLKSWMLWAFVSICSSNGMLCYHTNLQERTYVCLLTRIGKNRQIKI